MKKIAGPIVAFVALVAISFGAYTAFNGSTIEGETMPSFAGIGNKVALSGVSTSSPIVTNATTSNHLTLDENIDTLTLWFNFEAENPDSKLEGWVDTTNEQCTSGSGVNWNKLPVTTTTDAIVGDTSSTTFEFTAPAAGVSAFAFTIDPVPFGCLRLTTHNSSTTDNSTVYVEAEIERKQ